VEARAIARPAEDVGRLRALPGVEVVYGAITDADSFKRAVQGMRRVYHTAARTGLWGLEDSYSQTNVPALASLVHATIA